MDQWTLEDVQIKVNEAFERVWTEKIANGMKLQALPSDLKVVEALAKNPAMIEVVKKLVRGVRAT